jgi:hypothetical protein
VSGAPSAARLALIVHHPVMYAVLTREVLIVDIVVAIAAVVVAAIAVVVSGSSPRAYKLKRSK